MTQITETPKITLGTGAVIVSCSNCGAVLYQGPGEDMPLEGACLKCPEATGGCWIRGEQS